MAHNASQRKMSPSADGIGCQLAIQEEKEFHMKKKAEQPVSHPDDLIVVGIRFSFQAKENPDGDDRLPLPAVDIEQTFEARDSVEFLDEVVAAIRDRRLFGFI